jgi:Clostripain family
MESTGPLDAQPASTPAKAAGGTEPVTPEKSVPHEALGPKPDSSGESDTAVTPFALEPLDEPPSDDCAARDPKPVPEGRDFNDGYTRVLVFMDVSTPDLVPAASAALAGITTALQRFKTKKRLLVRVLVHGYQIQGTTEVGSKIVRYDRPWQSCPDPPELSWQAATDGLGAYLPADPAALEDFVAGMLNDPILPAPLANEPRKFGAILFIWGHGQGVGHRLERARDVDAFRGANRLTPEVVRPSLLNVSRARGTSAKALCRALKAARDPNFERRKLDVLILDSCLMGSVEALYEFRQVARFAIASQTLVERPGLNLGKGIVEYLAGVERLPLDSKLQEHFDEEGRPTVEKSPDSAPRVTDDACLQGAKRIVGFTGALHSGASHLTLVRLERYRHKVQPRLMECSATRPSPSWEGQGKPAATEEAKSLATHVCDSLEQLIQSQRQQQASRKLGYQPLDICARLLRDVESSSSELWNRPWLTLFWLFTILLRWASADAEEAPRILTAFRRAYFVKVRQFLDLKDLARQIHEYSRFEPLQVVALDLMRELEQRDDGFVVLWRAVIPEAEKTHYSGVNVYCPWFDAQGPDEFDVVVEHGPYSKLTLPRVTGWAGFALGPIYDRQKERSAWERRLEDAERRCRDLLLASSQTKCGCGGHDAPSTRDFKGSGPQGDGVKGSGPQADVKGSGPQADGF